MKQVIIFFSALLFANKSFSQSSWISAELPGMNAFVNCLFNDTLSNRLYAGGFIPNPWQSTLGIMYYDGAVWHTLGNANDRTVSITRYNNDIVASGLFSLIDGINVSYIAKYNGASWTSFGNFNAPVLRVKIINSELYAMGSFSVVDGISCKGIAKWSGTSWEPVFNFPFDNALISDAEAFQGDLYVGGNGFENDTVNFKDIAVYKNGAWQMVGIGIQGLFSTIEKIVVFNNELYVGGLIWRSTGNAGDGIQKWNGNNWSNLNSGLGTGWPPQNSQPHVHDIKVINDEMYVAGSFDYADSLFSKSLAKWDGLKWCNFPTSDFVSTNLVVEIFNDTIYTGSGHDTIGGDTINYLAKLLSLQPFGCTPSGWFEKIRKEKKSEFLLPTPADGNIFLRFEQEISGVLNIYNSSGERVHAASIELKSMEKKSIDLSALPSGVYFVSVKAGDQMFNQKFIKK